MKATTLMMLLNQLPAAIGKRAETIRLGCYAVYDAARGKHASIPRTLKE